MKQPIIQLDEVWKTYKMGSQKVHALQGVSLKVYPGEFLAILGKSGSGKSTMMNIIGCLDTPTKGKLHLDGKNVKRMSESQLAQIRGKKIGFVFQQFNLIPTLTATENVALPGEFQARDTDKTIKEAERILKEVDLGSRSHHKPTELSGGQMQRVAIARSLINDPELVLADEPTGALDSKTGEQVIKLLQNLNKEKGKSIVIVTHDKHLAEYAQRIIELKDGQIIKERKGKKR